MKIKEKRILFFLIGWVIYQIAVWILKLDKYMLATVSKGIIFTVIIINLRRKSKLKKVIRCRDILDFRFLSYIAAGVYVMVFIGTGFVSGFGRNPFDISLKGVVINLLGFLPVLIFVEMFRERAITFVSQKQLFICLITISFTLTSGTISGITRISTTGGRENIEFLCGVLLPLLIVNYAMTELSVLGGATATIAIRSGMELPRLLLPVLPDLNWIFKAVLDIVFALTALMVIKSIAEKRDDNSRPQKENIIPIILTYNISTAMVWFSLGLFPKYPIVILTGSMEPVIHPGDIAIIQKVKTKNQLSIGDIIQYDAGSFFIVHRIISIEGGRYKTKGDNNNTEDEKMVRFEQVKGKVVFRVPELGKPVLFIKTQGHGEKDEVRKQYELGGD